ncbi:MAG: hypothetical protein ACJ8CR_19685 [Roseiflexaceae bacterium]
MLPYIRFDPLSLPAPALEIQAISPVTGRQRAIRAKLDTGADGSIIPEELAADLALASQGQFLTIDYFGMPRLSSSYRVDFIVDGRQFVDLEVTTAPLGYVLLGRDVLNHLILTLDGPQLHFAVR